MTLLAQIKADYMTARKARKALDVALLSTLVGEVEMIGKNAGREVTDAEVIARVKKFLDGIESTIQYCTSNNNATGLATVVAEKEILSAYMPKQMTEAELTDVVKKIIANLTFDILPVNMGAVMAILKKVYEGQYDGKMASAVVKAALAA